MNTIYKSILALGAGLISLGLSAQDREEQDLTRQVNLEREYNPTLNEAAKINTAPNIFSPKVQSAKDVRFLEEAPQLNIKGSKLGSVASGDIRTDVPFSKQRFYLKAGAGSHGNLNGVAGVRAVDTANDKLDITASHSGTSGNINYAEPVGELEKVKAKYNDTKVGLQYQHSFQPSIFNIGGWYQTTGYNYYGNPFAKEASLETLDLDTKQKIDLLSFYAGLRSSDENAGLLKYAGNLSYTSFKAKEGTYSEMNKGPKGGIFQADVDFYTALGEGNIGIGGNFLNESFTGKDDYTHTGAYFEGLTNITANPYYKIAGINWDVNIGANLSFVDDGKSKFVVAPNLTAQVHINELNTLYGGVTGGVNNNTFVDIIRENRYASLASQVNYSKTVFDINAGFKSGIVPNLEFEIFGGYKQTKDDHLFVTYTTTNVHSYSQGAALGNITVPVYDQVSTGHFGGQVKTKLIPATTLKARLTGYFYNLKEQDKAWERPTFTAELTADIKPIDKLTLSLQYLLEGGRKGFYDSMVIDNPPAGGRTREVVSMKAINELNAYAEYEVVKYFSVHAIINNILNQKYEQHLGYTMQGINFLGGINLKF